jgi:hypothetical protein
MKVNVWNAVVVIRESVIGRRLPPGTVTWGSAYEKAAPRYQELSGERRPNTDAQY